MTTKTIKTILFASLIAAMILPFSGMSNVNAEELTDVEITQLEDELGLAILKLKVDNQQLEMIDKASAASLERANNIKIDELMAQMSELKPDLPIAELSDSYIKETDSAMDRLVESGLPILTLNVNDSTGIFEVEVDLDRAVTGKSYDKEIREIVGNNDVPLEISYGHQVAFLQAPACSGQSGDCNPIIGGSFAEEGGIAQDCTLTIADIKSSDNVMITVHHCNPSHNDMWQNKKGVSGDEMGPHHTVSNDSECDCDLYEVTSRSINQYWLNWAGSNVVITGRTDASTNDLVVGFGGVNGADFGKIIDTDVRKYIPGFGYMDKLYEIEDIDTFGIGDSGAPYLRYSDMKFVGMNNAGSTSSGISNWGHEWSFIESSLGL